MNNRKILFIDIDETLVDNVNRIIPESTMYSLNELKEMGVDLVLASGRNFYSMQYLDMVFPYIKGFISINGSCLIYNGEIIYQKSIPFKKYLEIEKYGLDHNIPMAFVTNKNIYVSNLSKELEKSLIGLKIGQLFDLNGELFKYDVYPNEIWILASQKEYPKELINFEGFVPFYWPTGFGYDLVPSDVSKKEGIKKFIEILGYSIKNTYAIGDGDNDAEMLEVVNFGIAMGNAVEKTKQAADLVTDSVRDNGFYKACVKVFGIKENDKYK